MQRLLGKVFTVAGFFLRLSQEILDPCKEIKVSEQDLGHENSRPGFKYHTSKWDCNIIDLYELLWDDLKGKDVSILEFGVYFGESLRYWKEFLDQNLK